MFSKRKTTVALMSLSLLLFAAGCKKKTVAPPPPPPPKPTVTEVPPTPPAPVVSQFSAEPTSIQRGQSATLRWEVTGTVTTVSIDQGIGTVQNVGNRRVTPTDSTTYTLTASGPGGNTTRSATVSVSAPPPPVAPPPPAARPEPFDSQIASKVQDAFFDYDKSDIRDDAREVLTRDAAAIKGILADFPNAVIIVEGHCDERGSAEYNLGLGDRRATAAKDFLVQLGVPDSRLRTVSFGKERPQCTDANEACYQRNRRAHFSPGQ